MLKTKKRMWMVVVSGVLVLAVAGVWLFGSAGSISAAETLEAVTESSTPPGLLSEGYLMQGGGMPGFKGGDIDYPQLLADALGITVDELEAAHEAARDAAIDQALEVGLITQEQADNMKVWGALAGRKGFDIFRFGRAPKAEAEHGIDENALLADALGITVEELEAAREAANEAAIAEAVAQGLITQEQADAMQARKALMSYLDRKVLLAGALGITVEELEAAHEEGKTLTDLMIDAELDATTVRDNLREAHADALAQAVEDGVITQEQADEMGDGHGQPMPFGKDIMPRGRMPMRGRGRGGFRGDGPPCDPETMKDGDTSGTGFGFPGRPTFQGGNDL